MLIEVCSLIWRKHHVRVQRDGTRRGNRCTRCSLHLSVTFHLTAMPFLGKDVACALAVHWDCSGFAIPPPVIADGGCHTGAAGGSSSVCCPDSRLWTGVRGSWHGSCCGSSPAAVSPAGISGRKVGGAAAMSTSGAAPASGCCGSATASAVAVFGRAWLAKRLAAPNSRPLVLLLPRGSFWHASLAGKQAPPHPRPLALLPLREPCLFRPAEAHQRMALHQSQQVV